MDKNNFFLHLKTKRKKQRKTKRNEKIIPIHLFKKFPLIATFLRSIHDANILHFVSIKMTMIP